MLTQFFGNYLVDRKLITSDQLIYALRHKHEKNQTMAAMALSLGYMTEEETEDVHNMQVICDEEFISLALRMNYLTSSQAAELEEAQHFGYLLLARSVVELGFCDAATMSDAIADYEFDFQLSFSNCLNFDKDKIQEMIHNYYNFPDDGQITPAEEYAVTLMNNLIRFIGDDFRLDGKLEKVPDLPDMIEVTQHITGEIKGGTAIIGYKDFMEEFAKRYAGEELEDDEYVSIAVQDFLNQHNGLFSISLSQEHDMEIELTATEGKEYDKDKFQYSYILPVEFTFGLIYFCFSL